MGNFIRQTLLWLPFLALLGLAVILVQRTMHVSLAIQTPINNTKMPRLALEPLTPDKPLDNQALQGQPVLVNFFASWCGPCAAENDVLVDLAKQQKITIVGIALKDRQQPLEAYLQGHGNPYNLIGMDNAGRNAIEWGVSGVPETFAVNAAGMIKAHHEGILTLADAAALTAIALKATKPENP